MKIYRTELDSGIDQKLFDINAEKFSLDEIEFYSNDIKGILSADCMSNGYHIRGKLNVPYKLTCDRCLIKYNELKEVKFTFILTDDSDLNYDESDDVIHFPDSENEFDLNPLFQELILLEIQMKTICKYDCKGLCSICGTNLNKKECDCSNKIDTSPWDAIKNLKG